MGGSKKGERRGNARRRASNPAQKPKRSRTHESPNEIMRSKLRHGKGGRHQDEIERRIVLSRLIAGESGDVLDVTPKETMLEGMHYNLQAVRDLKAMLEELAQLPPSNKINRLILETEMEIERLYDKAGELAFKCAGYIHPKLQAVNVIQQTGANQTSILQELLMELDERERAKPIPIEHKPNKAGGGQ